MVPKDWWGFLDYIKRGRIYKEKRRRECVKCVVILLRNVNVIYKEFEHTLMVRYGDDILNDSFVIDLVEYNALKVKVNDNNIKKWKQ